MIGCGNVAWHLTKQLVKLKFDITVYNHKPNKSLHQFSDSLAVRTYSNLEKIIADADHYFICVTDNAISKVLNKIKYLPEHSNIAITSGSYNLNETKTNLKNLSVFYPVQTFSLNDNIKWDKLCIVTDAVSNVCLKKTNSLAEKFTKKVIHLNYDQRVNLHLAAVLVNNFTNSLYIEADKLLKKTDPKIDIKILLPLIQQGVSKLDHLSPLEAQTGPAKRKDHKVISKHLSLLKKNKDLRSVYSIFSELIIKQQKKSHA